MAEKMNDNDIIKALECCGDNVGINHACSKCPKFDECNNMCETDLHDEALDLIKRQQAEIERLENYNNNLVVANTHISNNLLDEIDKAKVEAVKEFAEIIITDYPEMTFYLNTLVKLLVGEQRKEDEGE